MPSNTESLARVFQLLDSWRHLPSYRLESRADPFFGLYMRDVLSAHLGLDLHDVVIPELPLRADTIGRTGKQGKNQSVKVDFALFSRELDTMYLVELKTDQSSRREKQDAYLESAAMAGGNAIIEGIVTLANTSSHRKKYRYLLAELAALGAVSIPDGLLSMSGAPLTRKLREATVSLPGRMNVEVMYVQPQSQGGGDVVDFAEFARQLPAGTDPLAAVFQQHLERWSEPAGASRAANG